MSHECSKGNVSALAIAAPCKYGIPPQVQGAFGSVFGFGEGGENTTST